jgi:predicted AAA+ superfamily ATPase
VAQSRHIISQLDAALSDTPVVLLHGPRQCGKTTLARSLCGPSPMRRFISLDDPAELYAAARDPRGYIEALTGPVVLDEVQRAPDLLVAIKMDVDRHRRPGRFLLTGSANVLSLPRISDSLAGRMQIVRLWPLSQGEIESRPETFIDRAFGEGPLTCEVGPRATSLTERLLRGGFPEPLTRPPERRTAWFESYAHAITQRDIRDLAEIDRLLEVPRILHLLASRNTGLLNIADISRGLGLPATTCRRYTGLLETMFQIVLLPAWASNLGLRLTKSPKVLTGDTGLAAALLGLTADRLAAAPTLLGPLLENFAALELLKIATWSRVRADLFHFRTAAGQEVDLVLEARDGRLIGVEVKAAKSVSTPDLRGLTVLKNAARERFHRGIVLYSGERTLPLGDRLEAVPIDALWTL